MATASPKGEEGNQDRALTFRVGSAGAGVVVCDGVGSYPASGAVADLAASEAARYVGEAGLELGTQRCAARVSAALNGRDDGATTLIVVGAEESGDVRFCFVGNGSLLEIQKLDGMSGPDGLRHTDLVLPHVSFAGGRDALRSFLPATNGNPVETSLGSYRVHPGIARLYLACSDGVATDESRAIGRAPDRSVWKEIPRPLSAILDDLAPQWAQLLVSTTAELELGTLLRGTLLSLLVENELDDDATVGALLLRPLAEIAV